MLKNRFQSEILFSGYYGQLNTGDDAFIEVSSWGADKYWNKTNILFLAKKEKLPESCLPIRGYPFNMPRTLSLQSKLLVSSTNYLISAGGSILCSKFNSKDIKHLALKEKKKHQRIKLGAIGVSIGPFKTIEDEKAIVNYLMNLNFLSVRDQASFDYLTSLDLPYKPINAFDLAALLPNIYGIEKNASYIHMNKKVVGISVCPVESISGINVESEAIRNNKTIDLLKLLDKNDNIHFKFFIINGHQIIGDHKITQEIINKVLPSSYEIIDYSRKTKFMWDQINSCDFVISTRLHAAIFACFSNIPFMLNEYHRKCSDFLDNVGYNFEYRLFNNEYDVVETSKTIINILRGGVYKVPTKVNEMKIKSELNFTEVKI